VDRQGNGVVQLKGWLYDPDDFPPPQSPFLTYVYDDWKRAAAIHREAWLAQEDLWIQKEIYRLIRQANDYVARCEPDGKQPDTFHNPNLTFHFDWKDNNMKVTVTNRLPRRQKLDLRLRVKFNKSANPATSSEIIQVADEPLEPKGAKAGAVRVVDINLDRSGIKRTGIYEVEQLLTWETAAVKRLDQIAIGAANTAHSSRTVSETPKTYRKDDVKQETKEGEGGGLTPPGGGMAGMMGGSGANMMKGGGFGGFGGGQQQAAILGVNGVLFDRYLEVSDQSRRVPVAVAMIVDQDHVDRVLTSFNNSVLRFLTTQVIINRYGNSVRPQLAGQMGDDGETRGLPGLPPMMSFGGSGSKGGRPFSPMPGGVTPGGAVPPGIDPEAGGTPGGYGMVSNEEAENNVELVIYGIVTLYERYPKRTIQVGDTKETK
jgi:hypothetical protein